MVRASISFSFKRRRTTERMFLDNELDCSSFLSCCLLDVVDDDDD